MRLTQAKLAREAGVPQSTMNTLINSDARWSPHLTRIARVLRTTVDFLVGETDDPDENAPPPAPEPMIQHVMMPVALPSENALARMFEGLLEAVDRSAPVDALARELAQLLPTGLSQLQGRLVEVARRDPKREAAPVLASVDGEPPR